MYQRDNSSRTWSRNHDWDRLMLPGGIPISWSGHRAYAINLTMYTHSPYSREEAACWNVASCSWEGGDTGWVHTSAPGCRGQDASSLGSLVFVSLATGLSYPLPTPILLPSPNCRASSSENSLFRRTLVVSSLIVSRLHWIFCKERRSAGFKLDRFPDPAFPPPFRTRRCRFFSEHLR